MDNENEILSRGPRFRVSMVEVFFWFAIFAVLFSTPRWFGMNSLIVFFYGTFGVLLTRLAFAMPVLLASVVAFVIATALTVTMSIVIQA